MSDSPFVSTEWLAERLDAPDIVVVDGSWYLPTMNRDPQAEYLAGHIPGAVRFDIDTVRDGPRPCPTCCRRRSISRRRCGALGIGDGMKIVVYDGAGLFSAPRVWWTFKVFGARDVSILEGGFPAWRAEGRPGRGRAGPGARRGAPSRRGSTIRRSPTSPTSAGCSNTGATQVVDARPADRFRGEAPEPRAGVRSGHMPGSLNLPFTEIVENGRLKEPEAIEAALRRGGRRPRPADHHELRLRRLGRDPRRRARERRPPGPRRSTTAPGPNGARARTCPSRRGRRCARAEGGPPAAAAPQPSC